MVVDDERPFRHAAHAVINATEGFEAVGDAESGREALSFAHQLHPELVLLDVNMPEMDGFETARCLTEAHPACVVVLVSCDALEWPAQAVTTCGAVDFIPKQELCPSTLRSLWLRHGPSG